MADNSVANSGESAQPRNHDLISTIDAPAFTFDWSELEAQLDNDPDASSQVFQFPGDLMDFSSQVTTIHQTETLDQQPCNKNVSSRHVQQHEPIVNLSNSGAELVDSILTNQYALPVDESWNRCSGVLDGAQTRYPTWTTSLLEGSALDAPGKPPSIESETLKQQNLEQVAMLKKRHLDIEDGELYSPRLGNDKRQKTAGYDFPNTDQVNTVEASFFEDWLSKFPDVFPGPKQFGLLAGLTQLKTEAVQSWFNERLRNGPRPIAFTNLPMKPPATTEAPHSGIPQMNLTQQPSDQPVQQHPDRTLDKVKLEASNWVREHKAKKCRKRRNPKNFARDPKKPYCCTLGCGTNFKDKDDWRKHEERNYPQGGWICNVGSIVQFDGRTLCAFCEELNPKTDHNHGKALCSEKKVKTRGRLHFRKQHFSQHFIRVHPSIPYDRYLESNHFTVNSKFPRRCGFCRYLSKHWRDRIEHIGGHFIAGKDMSQWDFGVEDDEVDQFKDADHENPNGDGGFNGKRHRPPDDESDFSDDDSNSCPPKSAPKQRRRNTKHTYARQTCDLIQSRDIYSAKDFGRTTHIRQEKHTVPLNDSFLDLDLPNVESENISFKPSSIAATIVQSVSNNKLTRPFVTGSNRKRTRSLLSNKCRAFNITVDDMAIERSRHYRVSLFRKTCENSENIHMWTSLSTQNDLAGFIKFYAGTLIPSTEAMARWCKLLTSGNINSDTQSVISVTRYAPKISENLLARWNANISSLCNLLLDVWRLLVDDDRDTFKGLLEELFSSSALNRENFAQFQEWISLLRKNGHIMRTRVDKPIAFNFPSYLYSRIHLQPTEKPLVPEGENQSSIFPTSIDTTSEVSITLCTDVQSVSSGQEILEVPRHHISMSQASSPMSNFKSITPCIGNASAQTAIPDETFRGKMTDCSLFPRSNDLLSLYASEVCASSTGVESGFWESEISFCSSFLETKSDFEDSVTTKSSYLANTLNYTLAEPFSGSLLTEPWLQSSGSFDISFATPLTALGSISPTFPDFYGHDLGSTSGVQGSWSPIVEDLGSITSSFLSPDPTSNSTEHSNELLCLNTYESSNSWDYTGRNQKKGRTGPLPLEIRKKARSIRKIGACWRCRFSKAPCDPGTPCIRCAKETTSRFKVFCVRTRISDYSNTFLPDTITSRYSETAIQDVMRPQYLRFTNNRIEVSLTSGYCYPPIRITAYEFIPLHRQSLHPYHTSLVELNDIPLALLHYDPAEVKDKLSKHVKAVIDVPPGIDETISGENWMVSYKAFGAINKYRCARDTRRKDRILEIAFELHTMHYIMSRLIIIEPSSASQVFAKLRSPHAFPYKERSLSSNIINLQLKCEMVALLRETTAQFLLGLERILKIAPGNHATWSTAFCLMLVVCSCIEAVEIATDATIIVKMQKVEMTTVETLRAKRCQELDQVVIDHIGALFMCTYRSHRIQREGGFNPIRDGLELNEEKGITLPMVELVQDLRRIIEEYEDDINDRAKDLKFETERANLFEDHLRVRKQLSGRLVSKFLKGFGWQRS